MEYTLQTPALWGETVTLYSVVRAMANNRANASGSGFHKPTFDGAVPQYTNVLLTAAASGHLKVCNQCGDPGTPEGILKEAMRKGQVVCVPGNERRTLAIHVFVRLHHLNIWAQEKGDVFRIELVGWADERGHVWPSEPGKAKESPQADDCGGVQAAAGADNAVVPVGASGIPKQGLSTKVIAQSFDSLNGWSSERWTKNLSQSKWLHTARERLGSAGGASALWNPLTLAQLLYAEQREQRKKVMLVQTLRFRFKNIPILNPWSADLNEYFETYYVEH